MVIRNKWKLTLFLWVVLGMAFGRLSTAQAQEALGLKLSVDKREVSVGDKLTVTLEFRQIGPGQVVQEPSISSLEHFDIGYTSSSDEVQITNGNTVQIANTNLNLTATSAGEETLGPAVLVFEDPQGKKQEVKSNIVTVTVDEKTGFSFFGHKKANPSPPPSSAAPGSSGQDQIEGFKPPVSTPFSWGTYLFWLFVLALIVGFLWRQVVKSRKRKGALPPKTKPAQLRETWKKLSDEDLSSKEFCLSLSALVRECLEYRLGFPAQDRTTGEILRDIQDRKVTESEKDAAEKCLRACDRVLYADGNLTGRDALRASAGTLLPKIQKS